MFLKEVAMFAVLVGMMGKRIEKGVPVMEIIIIVIILFGTIGLLSRANKSTDKTKESDSRSRSTSTTISCPHCGSPAKDYGRYWECGYCGDCGYFR